MQVYLYYTATIIALQLLLLLERTRTEVIFESAASSDTIYFQINICR